MEEDAKVRENGRVAGLMTSAEARNRNLEVCIMFECSDELLCCCSM